MTTLIHLSDLHFDRIDANVVAALAESIRSSEPSCVILSGDLTQRAFRWQFRHGVEFLDQFHCPRLCIGGNHDVPMHRPLLRAVRPLARFHKFVTPDKMPMWDDGHVCVVGVNTARAVAPRVKGFWKDGAISTSQIRQTIQLFSRSLAPFRVLVTHHPMLAARPEQRVELVRGHAKALATFADFGVETFLYGHLHLPHILPASVRSGDGPAHQVVGVMAGTACSTRLRGGAPNSYNRLRFDEAGVTIESLDYTRPSGFAVANSLRFESPRRRQNPVRRELPANTARG